MGKKAIAKRDLSAGTVLDAADIEFRSPGDGIGPDEVELIIGRTLRGALPQYGSFHLEQFDGGSSY